MQSLAALSEKQILVVELPWMLCGVHVVFLRAAVPQSFPLHPMEGP